MLSKLMRTPTTYAQVAELLMCKLEYHKDEINWNLCEDTTFISIPGLLTFTANNPLVLRLKEEVAEEAALINDDVIRPVDFQQLYWAIHMVYYRNSVDFMAKYDLDPME